VSDVESARLRVLERLTTGRRPPRDEVDEMLSALLDVALREHAALVKAAQAVVDALVVLGDGADADVDDVAAVTVKVEALRAALPKEGPGAGKEARLTW